MRKRLDHKPLLSDRRIRLWYDEIALRSNLSAGTELRHVGLF